MPLYEYKCRECGHTLEARQKFSDEPLTHCPNCGAEQGLYRVVQPAGVVFKGSGFYITDSKGSQSNLSTPGKRHDSENGSSSSSTEGSKSTTSESSKPAESSSKSSTSSDS